MSFKGLYSVNKLRMTALLILEFLTSGLTIGVSYINTYQIMAVKEGKWQQFIVLIMAACHKLYWTECLPVLDRKTDPAI